VPNPPLERTALGIVQSMNGRGRPTDAPLAARQNANVRGCTRCRDIRNDLASSITAKE